MIDRTIWTEEWMDNDDWTIIGQWHTMIEHTND